MTAVLMTPPYLQFVDNNGNPLSGGKIYTYAAGTTTPKATYTDSSGTIPLSNPIILDSAGRCTPWLVGSYKFEVKDSSDVLIKTTDDVTAFTTLSEANDAYFQSFSGNGSQTAFTTSEDLGTEEKGLMVFVDSGTPTVIANGTFATDTIWTKGAGWTIGAGVATAAGAISTGISQTATTTLVAGQAYSVTYTITRSAGGLIPSIGGNNGTERAASGTYRETIVAGSTQTIAFTGNAFTGTLDDVTITLANGKGYEILNPNAYTINGTTLTFATAPASGTNNIFAFAPSLLLGAASAAAGAAEASATAALASEVAAAASASSAAAYAVRNKWTYSTTTAMADPTTGNVRLNNAALASVTQIAISDFSANSGNPNVSGWIGTWDDAGGTNRGSIFIFKDESNFAIYNVNSASTDNTTWFQLPVTYITHAGSFSNLDTLYFGFAASGTTTVTGGITALTGDVTASGSGSVAATIANNAVSTGKIANDAVTLAKIQNATAASRLLGSGSSGSGTDYAEITLGTNLSMSGTTLNAGGGASFADNSYLYFDTFDDFMGKAAASYSGATSGAGAVSGPTGLAYFVCATGSTSTGRASMRSGGVAAGNLYTALTNSTFSVNVDVEALSDAGQTYTARVGYINSDTGDPTDGIYFRYTHGTNSGNWQAVCRASGVESVINSSSPPLTGLGTVNQTLSFIGRSSSSVEFYINNTSIGTISTNVPAFSLLIANGSGGSIIKSVGTTSRSMDLAQLKTRRYR